MKELTKIQNELKVPKSQFNSFANFHYRSFEDICEAVKPLIEQNKCSLRVYDNVISIGGRVYVRAVAVLRNEAGEVVKGIGYAREDEVKKGMDGSQITGACSSYARKYALNGLFLLDDVKDADFGTTVKVQKPVQKVAVPYSAGGLKCEKCGATVSDKVAEFSKSKFKRQLCMNCQKTV